MASPLKIMIALHYWTTPTPYAEHDEEHRNSGAVRDAMEDFINGGLLRKREKPSQYGSEYEGTEALGVWVDALCSVRWPVQVWVVPKENATELKAAHDLLVSESEKIVRFAGMPDHSL